MTKKSIIIIGAGLAGLSTGCYSYTIDGGIHFLMCHKPGQSIYEIYRELGTAQSNRFLDMTSYCRFIDEASGRNVEITPDLEFLAKKLKALSPADSRFIDDLIAGARSMRGTDIGDMGMSQPQELLGFLDNLKQMWKMRRFFKYFMGKYSRSASDYK